MTQEQHIPKEEDLKLPQSVEEVMAQYPITPSFSSLHFGKRVLTESAAFIEHSLITNQQHQPFDLTPQIQELLHFLQKIPSYFSPIKRFFYRLPIIGFYFSPLRRLDQIRQQILQKIMAFDNLLKTQITQLQYKITAITALLSQNQKLLQETFNHQTAGAQIADILRDGEPSLQKKLPSFNTQLKALEINKISLTQHALQLELSLQSLQHAYSEMSLIHQLLFPMWKNQLKLIHQIVIKREPIKIIQSKKEKTPPKPEQLSEKSEVLAQLKAETEDNYNQDLFDITHVENIQQETIHALKALL